MSSSMSLRALLSSHNSIGLSLSAAASAPFSSSNASCAKTGASSSSSVQFGSSSRFNWSSFPRSSSRNLSTSLMSPLFAIGDLNSSYTNMSMTVEQWEAQPQTGQARLSPLRNHRYLSLLHLLPSRLVWVPQGFEHKTIVYIPFQQAITFHQAHPNVPSHRV
jgi:hypothetical protein